MRVGAKRRGLRAISVAPRQPEIPDSFPPQSPIVLYHFVRGAARLSRHADEMDQRDGTGKPVRAAFAETTGLGEGDMKAFFAFAAEARFAALDQQVAAIIAYARMQSAVDGLIPAPPRELSVLQTQKEALMEQLDSLLSQSTLSDDGKAAIRRYLSRAATHTNSVN